MDTATWKETLLYQNDSAYAPSATSNNEKFITLGKEIATDKNEIYLFNTQTKVIKPLSNDDEATWNAMVFAKKDNALYYTTNEGNEFRYLIEYNITSGQTKKLFQIKWDITNFTLSKNDRYGSLTINKDGKNKVMLFTIYNFKPLEFQP